MKGQKNKRNVQPQQTEKQARPVIGKEDAHGSNENTAYENKYHKIVIENKGERRNYKEPIVVATLILALITLLLFIATGLLYREAARAGRDAKRAADIATESLDEYKREFDATNRPDISLFDFKMDDVPNTTFLKCKFRIINTGRLRAKIKYITVKEYLGIDTAHYSFKSTTKPIPFNQYLQFNAEYNPEDLLLLTEDQKK